MTIRLPLPHRYLSPNGRCNVFAKAKLTKAYREQAKRETFKQLRELDNSLIVIGYILRPAYPNKKRRDDDNLIGSVKGARDGIADAFRQDDHTWRCLGVEPTVDAKDPHLLIEIITEDLS